MMEYAEHVNMSHESSRLSSVCQTGRTAYYEAIIDDRLARLESVTTDLLRWPIPRPLAKREQTRILYSLAWLVEGLVKSKRLDEVLTAQHLEEVTEPVQAARLSSAPSLVYDRERDFTPIPDPPVTEQEQAAMDRLENIRNGNLRTVTVNLPALPLDHDAATEAAVSIIENR